MLLSHQQNRTTVSIVSWCFSWCFHNNNLWLFSDIQHRSPEVK